VNISDLSIEKHKLRAHYRKERAAISNEARELLDTAICANVSELPIIKKADTVLVYYPVKNEPHIIDLIQNLFSMGKRVAFPVSNSADCTLTFKYVESLDDMVLGAYNIPEPSKDSTDVKVFSNCVCIVPALVFDRHGYRIGYGKGYYDRFLKDFQGKSIGIAYSQFVIDNLPYEPTDVTVDLIITERGIILPDEKE
jgi:5-formyltetrahydrofolate cyclo-ligase